MNESRQGENVSEELGSPESADLLQRKFENAIAEEQRILRQIDGVLRAQPNRIEAERIVLERYAPRMDAAMRKSREALSSLIHKLEAQAKQLD